MRFRSLAIAAYLLLAAGCSGVASDRNLVGDGGESAPDAASDSGADAEPEDMDSGTPIDAGDDSDGAPGTDSGSIVDAGTPGPNCGALATLLTSRQGYWPFDGSGEDVSGINADLSLIGDASYGTSMAPALGSALELDGEGDAAIARGFVKVASEYTVVVWAFGRNLTGSFNSLVKNWGQGQQGQIHLGLEDMTEAISNYTISSAGQHRILSPTDFPANEWVHVAAVLDATAQQQRLYINGARVADEPLTTSLTQGGATGFGVGVKTLDDGSAVATTTPGFWNGFIDEVAIFNTAASDAEVMLIYQQGAAGASLACSGF